MISKTRKQRKNGSKNAWRLAIFLVPEVVIEIAAMAVPGLIPEGGIYLPP